MSNLTFKHIFNLSEAEAAWKTLSPNKVIYDDWDFRFAYYKYFNYPLNFIAGFDGDQMIGLLPLMWNTDKNEYDFFAGFGYMEDNAIYLKPGYEHCKELFIKQIDKKANLEYMNESMSDIQGSLIHDYNYFIELQGMNTYEDFINTYLSSDGRKNLNSQIRKIRTNEIKIEKNNVSDIDLLEKWSKMRFGEQSSFNERPHWNEFFKEIPQLYKSEIITVSINGEKQGVGFVVYYKDICYGINSGYNPEIKNLGKFITLLKIGAAIEQGCRIYDAGGSGAFGWKEDFKLKKRPFYQLIK